MRYEEINDLCNRTSGSIGPTSPFLSYTKIVNVLLLLSILMGTNSPSQTFIIRIELIWIDL
jgi:hypothetical protein